jgi:sulfate permease, SulP family
MVKTTLPPERPPAPSPAPSPTDAPRRFRLQTWLREELTPREALASLNAAIILYLLEMIIALSVVVLIFSGPLAPFLPQAISCVLIGNALLVATVTVFSSYGGSMAVAQDTPGVILAVAAASVAGSLAGGAAVGALFPTVVVLLIGCSLAMGLVTLLMGIFKLGGLVRYMPFPVMAGFLAGSGWLLTVGGIGVASDTRLGPMLLEPDKLARWLPAMLLGVAMLIAVRRSGKPTVLATLFGIGLLSFYGVMTALNRTPAELGSDGWLLGPFPQDLAWSPPLTLQTLAMVDTQALWRAVPLAAPAVFISVIALLLNTSSLELLTRRDIRLDQELKATGVANLASGLAGGLIGYHAMSVSSLSHALGKGRRLPGLLVALLIVCTLLVGTDLLSHIPRLLLGGLLVYIGLAMLHEWLLKAWSTFSKADYAVVLAIFGIIATTDFLWGIGLGTVMTMLLFLVNYSRVDVVRHALSGITCRSRVIRSPRQTALLAAEGGQLLVLKLQGFIFFGTANTLLGRVQARTALATEQRLSYLVIDFEQVSGLDATAVLSLAKLLQFSQRSSIALLFTHLPDTAWTQLQRGGFDVAASDLLRFADLDRGVEWVEEAVLEKHGLARPAEAGPTSLEDALLSIVPERSRIAALLGKMHRRELAAGDMLLRQGDASDTLILMESGQLTARLERPGQRPLRLQTMRGATILGELGFFLGTARSASVVADTASVVHCLSQAGWTKLRHEHPDLASTLDSLVIHQLSLRVVHLTKVVDALG